MIPIAAVVLAAAAGGAAVALKGRAQAAPVVEPAAVRVEGGVVVMSPAFRERAGVREGVVKRARVEPSVRLVGTTIFDPENVSAVGSRVRGFVRRVLKVEGDSVEKGDVLAEIDSAELGAAQSEVRVMRAHKRAAMLNAHRERELAAKGLTTAREVELAEAALEEWTAQQAEAQQRAKTYGGDGGRGHGVVALRAPMRGTVVERRLAAGQSVENNHIAFRVADLDHLWIELEVFERELGLVHEGDSLVVTPLSSPNVHIPGRVAQVGGVVDATKKSAPVRVEIDNRARLLRSGQSVSAVVSGSKAAVEALIVPKKAITYVDGQAVVFVMEGELRAKPRHVTVGVDDGVNVAVDAGLTDGEKIAVEGVFALKSELYR